MRDVYESTTGTAQLVIGPTRIRPLAPGARIAIWRSRNHERRVPIPAEIAGDIRGLVPRIEAQVGALRLHTSATTSACAAQYARSSPDNAGFATAVPTTVSAMARTAPIPIQSTFPAVGCSISLSRLVRLGVCSTLAGLTAPRPGAISAPRASSVERSHPTGQWRRRGRQPPQAVAQPAKVVGGRAINAPLGARDQRVGRSRSDISRMSSMGRSRW